MIFLRSQSAPLDLGGHFAHCKLRRGMIHKRKESAHLVTAKHRVPLMVSLRPLHRLPGGARGEGDDGGEVGGPQGVLSHPISKLASQVDSSQSRHSVEVGKVCLHLISN